MAYTPEQLKQALQNAQQAGDAQAVQLIQGELDRVGNASNQQQSDLSQYSSDDLSSAMYKAIDAGDQNAAMQFMHAIRTNGGKLRPRNAEESNRAFQRVQQQNVSDSSAWDNFMAGAGKSVIDNFHGAQQLGAKIASGLPLVGDAAQAKYEQLKADQDEANQRDAALMASKSGLLGNIAGQVGQAVVGGSALKAAGLAGALGSGYGATATAGALQGGIQPLTSDQGEGQRLLNATIGAGAGVFGRGIVQGGGKLLGSGAQWLAGTILPKASDDVAALAKSAINDYGIPLKASQVSPSRAAKVFDTASAKIPLSGAQAFGDAQQQAFNRAVASTIGEDADQITPALYSAAKKRIGGVYDDITARNQIGITPDVQTKLGNVLADAQQTGSDDSIRAVTSLLGRINDQAVEGQLPGAAYQSIQSQLGSIAKSGGEKGNYAGQIKGILSSALNDSISNADQTAWQTANRQYGALKTIRNLVQKDGVNGDISPSALRGRVTASNAGKEAYASGRSGDLGQLAAIGQQFLKDGVPNSGTPERLIATSALGGLGHFASWPAALSTVAGARGYQALMQSPQVLAKVLQDPSIDQVTKSALLARLSASAGLLGQQGALAYRRAQASQSGYAPGLLQALP